MLLLHLQFNRICCSNFKFHISDLTKVKSKSGRKSLNNSSKNSNVVNNNNNKNRVMRRLHQLQQLFPNAGSKEEKSESWKRS